MTIDEQTLNLLEGAYPQEVLRWAHMNYGDDLVVVTSFQPTGIVTLHMLNEMNIRPNVITLDTGVLFPETYDLLDVMESRFDIALQRVQSGLTLEQQASKHGDRLWEREPDQCCYIRKTKPLQSALLPYNAWITGLRRDQSERRANTPVIDWDKRHDMVKLAPFVDWTEDMIWTYIQAHDLPYNPLHDQGYPSIGCTHCTKAVKPGEDIRSGRWGNHAKTECGIHLEALPGD